MASYNVPSGFVSSLMYNKYLEELLQLKMSYRNLQERYTVPPKHKWTKPIPIACTQNNFHINMKKYTKRYEFLMS